MYLDQFGDVRACCMNIHHPLGNVSRAGLLDIWHGERADVLRRAVAEEDFSLGCEWCEGPVSEGRPDLAFARWFDRFEFDEQAIGWPSQIEFSISNICNLQCVMCNGDWSSSIRSQREGREPLPVVYDEAFFTELDAFLPHLEHVKFLGGEPFLAGETLRIMDRLVALGLRPNCHITTNGTHWTPRVERILEMLPVDIALSLDAATPETYRSIRVGSDWDAVMGNLNRFTEHAERAGTEVSLTYCLMQGNWHEFGRFCRMADDLGLICTVNTVTQPAHLSLYHSGVDRLAEVVASLELEGQEIRDQLTLSGPTWDDESSRLRGRLEELRKEQVDEDGARVPPDIRLGNQAVRHRRSPEAIRELTDWRLHHVTVDAARVRLSVTSRVTEFVPGGPLAALEERQMVGSGSGDLLDIIRGAVTGVGEARMVDELHGCLAFRVPVKGQPDWAVLVEPIVDDEGYERGTTVSFSSALSVGT